MVKKKNERTIRSETTKVFLVIFCILLIEGTFTIVSAIRASRTFNTIREVHLNQFRAAELMKQKALDVIAIYYLMATDQDLELLMVELKRYDGLVQSFEAASKSLEVSYKDTEGPEKVQVLNYLGQIKQVFDDLNNACRRMTFAMMDGKKKESAAELPAINKGIGLFKSQLDAIEVIVETQLDSEANQAQALLKKMTWMGIIITFFAILITIGLIYYLMKFLSISLLPISNLMHNMRQAVFSIDKNLNVISPVSNYSNIVFGEEIVGKNVQDIVYKEIDQTSETYSKNKSALTAVFGETDLQWMLSEDDLMGQVTRRLSIGGGSEQKKILKLTYTPLMSKTGIIQNIMIVAEDVTEIEKLRAEAREQQGEMEIIQGIIGMDLIDLEAFLTASRDQMLEVRNLFSTMETNKESRQIIFRNLHTLKGNSRMYKLNVISEVVHVTESAVVLINNQLEDGEKLTLEHKTSLLNGIDSIDTVLSLHSKKARKLFGITDLYSSTVEEQFHKAMVSLEAGAKQDEQINTAIKTAKYFDGDSLVEVLVQLKDQKEKESPELIEEYLKLMLQNIGIKVFNRETAGTVSVLKGIVTLSHDCTAKTVQELLATAQAQNMGFIRLKATQLSTNLSDKNALSSLWWYMAGVCALESSYGTDEIKTSLLKAVSPDEFWQLAEKFMGLPKDKCMNAFVGTPNSKQATGQILGYLKDCTAFSWMNMISGMTPQFPLYGLLTKEQRTAQLQLDVMKLIGSYNLKNGVSPFENEDQTVKLPVICFNEIKTLAQELVQPGTTSASEKLLQLNMVIEQAFNFPLQSLFRKMEPMVSDLCKRMGKDLQFRITGENTGLDRERAYAVRDAMVHIIRNSLDHGIEAPEERVTNGKSPKATLEVKIQRNGNATEISVCDDGRGIDVDKLLKRAVSMGSLSEADAKKLTRNECLNLIFLPNLSTKDEVTTLSGRGVGMDAVKSIIDKMGGNITLISAKDKGTEIKMMIN